MTDRQLKKDIKDWTEKVGLDEARRKIFATGLSFTLAQKITSGTYVSEVKDPTRRKLLMAMKGEI